MRGNLPGILVGLLLAGILQGCSISPAQQEEIRKTWEERDTEQPGYAVNQPYVDAWGRYTYVQQWVPAQYVCY